MQRKLTVIAEIPKILSSTLVAVSQTFNKLTHINYQHQQRQLQHQYQQQHQQQHYQLDQTQRKFSYDEDLCDYELIDKFIDYNDDNANNNNDDDYDDVNANSNYDHFYNYHFNENEYCVNNDDNNILNIIPQWQVKFNAKNVYKQLKQHVAIQQMSKAAINEDNDVKELTPESDYVSEINDNDNNDNNDNNDIDNNVINENEFFHMDKTLLSYNYAFSNVKNHNKFNHNDNNYNNANNANNANDANDNDNDNDDDSDDFLNASFTGIINKIPKFLQTNKISPTVSSSSANSGQKNELINSHLNNNNNNDNNNDSTKTVTVNCKSIKIKKFKPFVQLDKIENNWPWADRKKIIYKQSTCHLVPKKPLGIIEKRIQLLAKNNLLQHLNRTTAITTTTN